MMLCWVFISSKAPNHSVMTNSIPQNKAWWWQSWLSDALGLILPGSVVISHLILVDQISKHPVIIF